MLWKTESIYNRILLNQEFVYSKLKATKEWIYSHYKRKGIHPDIQTLIFSSSLRRGTRITQVKRTWIPQKNRTPPRPRIIDFNARAIDDLIFVKIIFNIGNGSNFTNTHRQHVLISEDSVERDDQKKLFDWVFSRCQRHFIDQAAIIAVSNKTTLRINEMAFVAEADNLLLQPE
uniref:AAA_12 domain-containing protein n=1 Tax=Caenorhabditis tropicalis TaxID=1561998 RepID=A0A1I7UEU4_9PELO